MLDSNSSNQNPPLQKGDGHVEKPDTRANAPGIVFLIDNENRISAVNQVTCDLLGFSEKEILGKPAMYLFDNRESFETTLKEIRDKSHLLSDRLLLKSKAGTLITIEFSGSLLIESNNRSDNIIITAHNISTNNNNEIASGKNRHVSSNGLIKPNRDLSTRNITETDRLEIMNSIDLVILLCDKNGKIIVHNKALNKLINNKDLNPAGKDWKELLMEKGFTSESIHGKKSELFQQSTKQWYLLNSYPFKSVDADFSGHVITIKDNTDVKFITDELINSTEFINTNRKELHSALSQISILMSNVTKETDTSIRLGNPHLEKCYEVKNCKKKNCPCYGKEASRCWQIAGTYCGGEVQGAFAQKFGNCTICEVYTKASADPIFQIGEQFNNMMHVIETKNHELEDAYKDLRTTQSHILQQEKMASIGQLAAGVAHEINNPMGFISSNLGTMSKYIEKLEEFIALLVSIADKLGNDETTTLINDKRNKLKISYILEDIMPLIMESLDGAERVKSIVKNLKSFSRVDEADIKQVNLNECIESTLNIIWNELKYTTTILKEYGTLPLTKCYPQQINQVIMNLLINAAHSIESQGEIKIKTWNENSSIHISISDTGCGIPEDKINSIFEPFFTTKEVGKGTGLGLSITYNIIQKHNGKITVESGIGKGTTFTAEIPIVE